VLQSFPYLCIVFPKLLEEGLNKILLNPVLSGQQGVNQWLYPLDKP
jgi:hypothetical protein